MNKRYITLNDAILRQRNSLNFIRLLLALLVIFGHAFPLVLGSGSKLEGLAGLAVNLFFCISGFLILASAERGNALGYLWRRFLRIFPGYWVSLLFVAFIAAPIAFALGFGDGAWSLGAALSYIGANADLYQLQYGLGESPKGVPYPDAWNGSAWTLGYEFLAYLLLIPLAFTPWVKKYLRWTVTLAFIASLGMYPLLEMVDATTNRYYVYARLIPMFLAGSLLYVWGQKVRVYPLAAIVCSCLAVIAQLFAPLAVFQASQIFFAYGALALAATLKIYWGYKNDLSYGVYIYAFPLQQLALMFGSVSLGIIGNFLLVSVASMIFAYFSWNLIEKPSIKLKQLPQVRLMSR